MRIVGYLWGALRGFLHALRLALPKIGVGWMFALLTIDFNRIAIFELGIAAVLVTTMLGLHHILSPFQVVIGRFADRHPIWGFRRTPYLLLSAVVSSIIFMLLPGVAQAMGTGSPWAFAAGWGLLILFGLSTATIGDSHNSLIVESTTPQTRGGVVSVVQIITIMSTIFAAIIMNIVRPEYTPEAMQRLYNLTPFMVIIPALLGVVGLEKRLSGRALQASMVKARAVMPEGNPLAVAWGLLNHNRQARNFFFVIFLAIFSIFLQDSILEVFGAEAFGLSVAETTKFQPAWGGGVLVGMVLMGLISVYVPVSKRIIALIGCFGTAAGMSVLAAAALTNQVALVQPALIGMGFFTGFFNVGALSLMMDMTIEGATGTYMGLWGMAQAFGNAAANIGSGAIHTSLIETGILNPHMAYTLVFGLEAVGMLVVASLVAQVSTARFRTYHQEHLTRHDLGQALEAGAVA